MTKQNDVIKDRDATIEALELEIEGLRADYEQLKARIFDRTMKAREKIRYTAGVENLVLADLTGSWRALAELVESAGLVEEYKKEVGV